MHSLFRAYPITFSSDIIVHNSCAYKYSFMIVLSEISISHVIILSRTFRQRIDVYKYSFMIVSVRYQFLEDIVLSRTFRQRMHVYECNFCDCLGEILIFSREFCGRFGNRYT